MIGSIRKGGQSEVLDKMRPVPYIQRYLDLAGILFGHQPVRKYHPTE